MTISMQLNEQFCLILSLDGLVMYIRAFSLLKNMYYTVSTFDINSQPGFRILRIPTPTPIRYCRAGRKNRMSLVGQHGWGGPESTKI
jgi:hypothetical protein